MSILMADACAAVQWIDPATPCIVGPAPFCKLRQLNDAHFVDQSNIICTFDFFFPDVFFQAVTKYSCEECHTVTGQVCGSGVFFERRGESSGDHEHWVLWSRRVSNNHPLTTCAALAFNLLRYVHLQPTVIDLCLWLKCLKKSAQTRLHANTY